MYEAGLGRVMSGVEKASTVAEDADAAATATYQRNLQQQHDLTGMGTPTSLIVSLSRAPITIHLPTLLL